MKITYIDHSGFLVELEDVYYLFDYYQGVIPVLQEDKELVVFVSHKHHDHYNHEIWNIRKRHKKITYIISQDIPFSLGSRMRVGLQPEDVERVYRVQERKEYSIRLINEDTLTIQTLHSTDQGVAFLVTHKGTTIYHAGDLNLWKWKGESIQYNRNMTIQYEEEIQRIKDINIDVAFLPLDSRQEEYAPLGMEYFLQTVKNVKIVVPMHMWGNYEIGGQFKKEHAELLQGIRMLGMEREGEVVLEV